MRRFGQDEWSFTPSWTTESTTPPPTTESGIPYYLERPTDMTYETPPTGGTPTAGTSTSTSEWFGMGKDVIGTFLDIFGRPVQQPPVYQQPLPQPGIPIWGWALIGIGAVAAIGLVIRAARPSPRRRYSGRRRSRR